VSLPGRFQSRVFVDRVAMGRFVMSVTTLWVLTTPLLVVVVMVCRVVGAR
jgi:hypothetical protein